MKQAGKATIDAVLRANPAPDNRILFFCDTRVMSVPPAPFKTQLGLDELRHRTRGLGQRHRTVLLLVDGHRPLGEVLGMAHQAGASTSHFEELMRLGLVEMPVQPTQETPDTAPDARDQTRLTSVEVDVPAEPESNAVGTPALPGNSPDAQDEPEPDPAPAPEPATIAMPAPDVLPPSPGPKWSARIPFQGTAPLALADHARPRSSTSEEQLCQEVRSLLISALGTEAALFSPLILARIRMAQAPGDLIALVWDLERQRHHPRRSHAQRHSLQQARELLGMGNTMGAGDSQTGAVWPDTVGR